MPENTTVPAPVEDKPKPVMKQRKTWAGIIGIVLALVSGLAIQQKWMETNAVLALLAVVEGLLASFIGAESWKDGKVISAKILAGAANVVNTASTIAGNKPEDPTGTNPNP